MNISTGECCLHLLASACLTPLLLCGFAACPALHGGVRPSKFSPGALERSKRPRCPQFRGRLGDGVARFARRGVPGGGWRRTRWSLEISGDSASEDFPDRWMILDDPIDLRWFWYIFIFLEIFCMFKSCSSWGLSSILYNQLPSIPGLVLDSSWARFPLLRIVFTCFHYPFSYITLLAGACQQLSVKQHGWSHAPKLDLLKSGEKPPFMASEAWRFHHNLPAP